MAVGLNRPKKLELGREEIPDADHAEVVVDIVVPVVVDVEAIVVEVADTDEVAIGGLQIIACSHLFSPKIELYGFRLFALFPEFYLEAVHLRRTSPPRTSKKFNLYLFPRSTAIPACRQAGLNMRYSGESSRISCMAQP